VKKRKIKERIRRGTCHRMGGWEKMGNLLPTNSVVTRGKWDLLFNLKPKLLIITSGPSFLIILSFNNLIFGPTYI
jgi:hypothetical protein